MSAQTEIIRHTTRSLKAYKTKERIAMLTAYDAMTASCLDQAGCEILLVGDSLANVVYGFDSTLPVTMDMMLAHTAAVVRGSQKAMVIADLPFMSYQASLVEGLKNAGRCLAEAGAQAVKLEGASEYLCKLILRMVQSGIPVMGHIGLTPQSVHGLGGFYRHGKTDEDRARLLTEAKALEQAGCFAIVLECIESPLAAEITAAVSCLTIGIGSGKVCDGEVLVINDLLGYTPGKAPRFATPKLNLKELVQTAGAAYVKETKAADNNTIFDSPKGDSHVQPGH